MAQSFDGLPFGDRPMAIRIDKCRSPIPESMPGSFPAGHHGLTGAKLGDTPEMGSWCGNITERQKLRYACDVETTIDIPQCKQGLQFRCKCQALAVVDGRPIKWLLSKAVACQKDLLVARVDDGKRVHAFQIVEQRSSFFLEQMHQNFSIAACRKTVTLPDQLVAQLYVVVNLAVANHRNRAVFIANRLGSAIQIDNCQPQMTHQTTSVHECLELLAIGPAVPEPQLRLLRPRFRGSVQGAIRIEYAEYSAHN